MKWGVRRPSLRGRIAARTSWKRLLRHNLGFKVPRGWGWLNNPRKAAYNRIYNRTTISVDALFRKRRGARAGCCVVMLVALSLAATALIGLAQLFTRVR